MTLSLVAVGAHAKQASDAEIAFNKEVLECAAYYEIASDAIANMNAPQMAAVGDRLKQSSQQAVNLAKQYQADEDVQQVLAAQKQAQLDSLPNNKALGRLMGKYKEPCKTLLAEPQKRLDYWIMATM
ncbi:hypothetical protein [Shewanella waksmanii]|uniref:hypothetical protein n=1 Tax=Shewanella waksmanii TaxID=213783 RepID=UPI00373618C9